MKEVGRGGRSGPGTCVSRGSNGARTGLSNRSGNAACLQCPGGVAMTLGRSPSSLGPGSCHTSSGRTHTQGWWDGGGLTQCNDERTELDTVGTPEGGVCYCCCSCHRGQQMRSWALRPDTQPPVPGPMPDPPSPLLPTSTWLLLAQICPAWDPPPAGGPWEQRGSSSHSLEQQG